MKIVTRKIGIYLEKEEVDAFKTVAEVVRDICDNVRDGCSNSCPFTYVCGVNGDDSGLIELEDWFDAEFV